MWFHELFLKCPENRFSKMAGKTQKLQAKVNPLDDIVFSFWGISLNFVQNLGLGQNEPEIRCRRTYLTTKPIEWKSKRKTQGFIGSSSLFLLPPLFLPLAPDLSTSHSFCPSFAPFLLKPWILCDVSSSSVLWGKDSFMHRPTTGDKRKIGAPGYSSSYLFHRTMCCCLLSVPFRPAPCCRAYRASAGSFYPVSEQILPAEG